MKKTVLALVVGLLLVGVNAFAAGDLIVDGKLGVGTTTPEAKLDVSGNLRAFISSTNTSITAVTGNAQGATTVPKNVVGGMFTAAIRSTATDNGWVHSGLQNQLSIANNSTVSNSASVSPLANFLVFNVASGNTATFDSTAPVTMANFKLLRDNSGTVNMDSLTGLLFDTFLDYRSGIITAKNLTYADFREMHGGKITNITNTVGLKMLDLNTGYSTNNTNFLIGTGTTGNWSIYNNSTKNNYFAGNVGIGTTNPQSKLAVAGLPTTKPAGSTTQGMVCITTAGDMWIDTTPSTPCN